VPSPSLGGRVKFFCKKNFGRGFCKLTDGEIILQIYEINPEI